MTVTTTRAVTVLEVSSISVTTAPAKTAYKYGEKFSSAGMVITANYSDNATRDALSNAIDAANGLKDGNDPAKIDGARKTVEDAINGVAASVQAKTDADAQAAAAAAQAQAQAQSAYNGGSSYSGGAYRRTEGSASGSTTYRGTTSGGTGSPSGSVPKPNLNGSYGCTEDCYVPPNNLIQH